MSLAQVEWNSFWQPIQDTHVVRPDIILRQIVQEGISRKSDEIKKTKKTKKITVFTLLNIFNPVSHSVISTM